MSDVFFLWVFLSIGLLPVFLAYPMKRPDSAVVVAAAVPHFARSLVFHCYCVFYKTFLYLLSLWFISLVSVLSEALSHDSAC